MQATDLSPFMEIAISEVLEMMCFTSSEGETADEADQMTSGWICGELDFVGDTNGRFGIAVLPTTAATIAANFLGEEEVDLSDKEVSEVIGELTNMTCGTLLAQVNSQKMFKLSPPRVAFGGIPDTRSERLHRVYALDEGHIHAWVEMAACA